MGVLLTAFLGPVLTLCCAFPGYIARDLIDQHLLPPLPMAGGTADANATLPHLVSHFLGPGVRGFVVAAVLAAIMSTVSSVVNATATVFTVDVYQRWIRPQASQTDLVKVGRWAGTLTLLIAAPLSVVAMSYKYIFIYSQNAWCILAIPIMLAFTLGVFWKGATAAAANATFLLVLPFVAVPFVLGDDSWLTLPWVGVKMHLFTFAFCLWVAAALFMIVVSLLTPRSNPAGADQIVWRPHWKAVASEQIAPRPWYQSVGFWCGVAALMYALIYLRYW